MSEARAQMSSGSAVPLSVSPSLFQNSQKEKESPTSTELWNNRNGYLKTTIEGQSVLMERYSVSHQITGHYFIIREQLKNSLVSCSLKTLDNIGDC